MGGAAAAAVDDSAAGIVGAGVTAGDTCADIVELVVGVDDRRILGLRSFDACVRKVVGTVVGVVGAAVAFVFISTFLS